jgi:hypothetical protein
MAMLTQDEIRTYRQDGWVVPRGFRLKESEIAALQAAMDKVQTDNPDILPDRLSNPHLDGAAPYHVRGQKAFYDIAHDPRILDMAEALLGPDVILMLTHLFCKPPGGQRAVPWHQDGPYWPIEPMVSCTVWVAIDKVDESNGAMRVIPGSHRGTYRDHHLIDNPKLSLNREIDLTESELNSAVAIELEAGQVSLHDIGLIHGSSANVSTRRHAGLTIRYIPATAHIHRNLPNASVDWTTMPVKVVRGANRNAGNDFAVGDFGRAWH